MMTTTFPGATHMPGTRQRLLSWALHHYPLLSGSGSLANHGWVRSLTGQSEGLGWAEVSGGQLLVPLEDFVGRAAYLTGDLDRKITWLCRQILREGDRAVDIGANLGLVTVLMARLVGAKGRVDAFEPNPRLCDLLATSLDRNAYRQVRLHRHALGADTAVLDLHVPAHNLGAASLVRHQGEQDTHRVKVRVETLDHALRADVGPIRLMKIDVEGFEHEVLRGASTLFAQTPPQAVLFELNDRQKPLVADEPVVRFLRDAGYDIFWVPKRLLRMAVHPLAADRDPPEVINDLIALHRSQHYDALRSLIHATP